MNEIFKFQDQRFGIQPGNTVVHIYFSKIRYLLVDTENHQVEKLLWRNVVA